MIDEILLHDVEVLLQVDGREPIRIGTVITDRGERGLAQLAKGLIDLGKRMFSFAERKDDED